MAMKLRSVQTPPGGVVSTVDSRCREGRPARAPQGSGLSLVLKLRRILDGNIARTDCEGFVPFREGVRGQVEACLAQFRQDMLRFRLHRRPPRRRQGKTALVPILVLPALLDLLPVPLQDVEGATTGPDLRRRATSSRFMLISATAGKGSPLSGTRTWASPLGFKAWMKPSRTRGTSCRKQGSRLCER